MIFSTVLGRVLGRKGSARAPLDALGHKGARYSTGCVVLSKAYAMLGCARRSGLQAVLELKELWEYQFGEYNV